MEREQNPTVAELYPELGPQKRKEAEENLGRYAALALRVFRRLDQAASAGYPHPALTPPERDATDGMPSDSPDRPPPTP